MTKRDRGVAAALVLLGASLAGGSPPASAMPDPRERAMPQVVRRTVAQLPGGAELLAEMDEAAARGECECDFAYPVPDVSGDGTSDVLYGVDIGTPPATRLTILDGRTGDSLFAAPVEIQGWAYAAPADLGTHGRGLVYFSWDYLSPTDAVTIGAVSSRGARLWERRWDGYRALAPTGHAELGGFQGADLVRGVAGATEIVVASSVAVAGPYGTPSVSTVFLERLSAATGMTVDGGAFEAETLRGVAVHGVDATEGASDVLVQTSSYIRNDVEVQLRRDLGEAEWSVRVKSRYSVFMSPRLADVVGDRAAEILLDLRSPTRTVAFDRSTGRPVWSGPGNLDGLIPTSGGRRSELLLGTTMIDDGTVDYALARRSIAGTLRWKAAFHASADVYFSTWGFGSSGAVGDATGDGSADVRVDLYVYEDDGDHITVRGNKQYLVDGRSGTKLEAGPRYFPLEGSFTRSGTDAIEFRRNEQGLEVAGLDGATSRVLWRSLLPVSPGSPPCSWAEDVLETETGPDLLFLDLPTAEGDKELVLDGASGKILWSL